MVEVHLYGKLRRYNGGIKAGQDSVLMLDPSPGETIATLLAGEGIPVEEIHHIFVNAKLLSTRTSMGEYYGYRQVGEDLSNWDLSMSVASGDRLGLFGKDMAILGM